VAHVAQVKVQSTVNRTILLRVLCRTKPVYRENQCNAAKHVCMDRITALNVFALENPARPENMRPAEDNC